MSILIGYLVVGALFALVCAITNTKYRAFKPAAVTTLAWPLLLLMFLIIFIRVVNQTTAQAEALAWQKRRQSVEDEVREILERARE